MRSKASVAIYKMWISHLRSERSFFDSEAIVVCRITFRRACFEIKVEVRFKKVLISLSHVTVIMGRVSSSMCEKFLLQSLMQVRIRMKVLVTLLTDPETVSNYFFKERQLFKHPAASPNPSIFLIIVFISSVVGIFESPPYVALTLALSKSPLAGDNVRMVFLIEWNILV